MNLLELLSNQANNPQANPLLRRLAQHAIGTQQGHDFGDIPVVSGAAETVTHPAMAAAAQLGLLLEAAQEAAKAYGGASQVIAQKNPLLGLVAAPIPTLARLTPGGREMAADAGRAYDASGGNLWERARAANEGGASNHPYAQGLYDAAIDPSNLLGPVGKLTEGTRLAKVGELLGAVDRAQGLPLEGLLGRLAKQRAAREALTTVSERGNVPVRDLLSGLGEGGRRGLGPELPPVQDVGLPPELGPLLPERGNVPRSQLIPGVGRYGGKGLGPALLPAHDVPLPPELGPAFPERGDVPLDQLLPQIGRNGGRGIGPLLPPLTGPAAPTPEPALQPLADLLGAGRKTAQATPLEGLLGAARDLKVAPVARDLVPPGAVTPAEELAAKVADLGEAQPPDFPALTGTRRELLAGLSRSDLSRLVSTAYNDVPRAIGNARNARPDPVDLAERAIERITGNNKLVQRLQQRAPDLAAWVAELPETQISAIADEPVQAAQQLGGDIAAGGTDKLIPYAGGLGAANRAIGGALAGGAVGGVTGALAEPDDRLGGAAKGAALGALAGGNVGAASPLIRHLAAQVVADPATWGKRAEGRLLADPQILSDVLTVVKRARGEGGTGVKGLQEAWNAFAALWKRMTVDTAKQLPQDATYRATVIEGIMREEFGIGEMDGRQFQRPISRERATGAWSLDNPYNQLLIQTGHADKIPLKSDLIGAEFTDAVTDKGKGKAGFTRFGDALAGGLIGMGSALKTVNPVSPVFGFARGAVDREWSAAIHHLIGVANDAWREAAANAGTRQKLATVADDFLAKLAQNGVDVTPLQGRGGLFSADEVAAVAGKQAGDDWHVESETVIRNVGNRVATLAGDFRDKLDPKYTGTVTTGDRLLGNAERAASKFAPFARWQIRSTPVLLEVAARHPVATLKALQETQRLGEEAKAKGKRAYQAGYDISTETPLLGAAARVRLGGKKGTWTIDPLSAVVPYGDAIGGGDDMPDDATAYQKVSQMLGQVGFGPSPLIQAAGYVTGQDYRAPGSLSRTAGLEQLGTLLPGVGDMKLPTGRNLLDAARGVVEPALADAGIKTTGPASATDPVARRYAELVFDQTGKPLADRANIGYLTIGTPEAKALMQQATREEALMAAAGNAVSLTSPLPSTAQGADAAAAQAARKPVIEAQDMVDQLTPIQGAMLQRQIDQYKNAHPESRVYDGSSPYARAQLLMADWERQNAILAWFPEIYQYQRSIAAEELGLVKPGTLAQKQRQLDEQGKATAVPGVENRLRVDPGAAYRLREINRIPGR